MTATRGRGAARRPASPTTIEELEPDRAACRRGPRRMLASGVCHSDLHVRDGEWAAPDADRDGSRGCRRRRGGRAGRAVAVGRSAGRAVVARPVRRLPRRAGAGTPWACPDSPSFRHRMPDGATVLTDRAGRAGRCRTAGSATMAERDRRPGGGRDRPPRRRRSGGRGAHRLLRDDRRRGRAQDRRGAGRRDAWPSSGSVASGCRA